MTTSISRYPSREQYRQQLQLATQPFIQFPLDALIKILYILIYLFLD